MQIDLSCKHKETIITATIIIKINLVRLQNIFSSISSKAFSSVSIGAKTNINTAEKADRTRIIAKDKSPLIKFIIMIIAKIHKVVKISHCNSVEA